MKSVSEFQIFTLNQGIKSKAVLTAESKTPEEIESSLGASFKLEGDKIKYFINAIDVAEKNLQNLKRVRILSLNEDEKAPHKAVKVEELYYVPEFYVEIKPVVKDEHKGKGGRGGAGKGRSGGRGSNAPKTSPWGMTPEEKALKNKGAASKTK